MYINFLYKLHSSIHTTQKRGARLGQQIWNVHTCKISIRAFDVNAYNYMLMKGRKEGRKGGREGGRKRIDTSHTNYASVYDWMACSFERVANDYTSSFPPPPPPSVRPSNTTTDTDTAIHWVNWLLTNKLINQWMIVPYRTCPKSEPTFLGSHPSRERTCRPGYCWRRKWSRWPSRPYPGACMQFLLLRIVHTCIHAYIHTHTCMHTYIQYITYI